MVTTTQRIAVPVEAPTTRRYGDFKPVSGTTGATIHVLNQEADHATSMKLLQEAGLRLYTYQEILPLLIKDEGLKDSLKDKWFYLAKSGVNKDGLYRVDEKGGLSRMGKQWTTISVEEKVRVWSGNDPLSLDVYSDDFAAKAGVRFFLVADDLGHVVAPVVVGTSNDCESAAEASDSLTRSVRANLARLLRL